ncbi:MAG: sulfotransferase domain-containing protein [Candidatus Binatia bacterium]
MRLPNFLIIGAQKSGTTWLGDMLREHPEVFVAPREIHFFDKGYNYARGLEWYGRHFAAAQNAKAIGEKTPDYFWPNGKPTDGHLPEVHRLLHAALPDARLIVILRDPVERAVSAARHLIMDGWVSPLVALDDLLVGRARSRAEEHGVIDYGYYARHLEAYLALFPRDRILVLIYEEDVIADPRSGLGKACEFLGVRRDFEFRGLQQRRNALRRSRPRLLVDYYVPILRRLSAPLDRAFPLARYDPSETTRRRLRDLYRPENERLYELLGRRLSVWG